MNGMGKHSITKRLWAGWALVRENPVLPVIAGIGFAVSFQTIAGLASSQHMPGWPVLYPLLIDVFLLGVVIEARRATDDGRSDAVPRLIAWVLAGFTLYINAHGSASGDWLGIALHVAAPAAWVTFLELSRWRKMRRTATRRERIPLARWVLSPAASARMYRWMVLHNITSYPVACAREEAQMLAADLAAAVYGTQWRQDAPTILRYQMRTGRLPDDVAALCGAARPGVTVALTGPVEEWITAGARQRAAAAERARREARPEPAPEPASNARPKVSAKRALERAPKVALKLTAAKSRSMSPEQVAEHVSAMLEEHGQVSLNRVKDDLSVGTDKAKAALEIAKRDRTVVPMERRA